MIEKQAIGKAKEVGFTKFFDMTSGGSQKLEWPIIYINLPETQAKAWFADRFNRDYDHVTCSCCGEDYAVYSANTLEEITYYHRNDIWRQQQKTNDMTWNEFYDKFYNDNESAISLAEYLALSDVLYVEIDKI